MTIIDISVYLLFSHVICDFILQTEYMAKEKYNNKFVLLAHSIIHGTGVYFITQNLIFFLLEIILHYIIDTLKIKNIINYYADQILHYICKIVYLIIIIEFKLLIL